MALTLWTDCYATLAEVDARMRLNAKWAGLPSEADGGYAADIYNPCREDIIRTAATLIDDGARWGGEKADDAQALAFPRAWTGWNDDIYLTAEQRRRLRAATIEQVARMVADKFYGVASQNASDGAASTPSSYPTSFSRLCAAAKYHLLPYARKGL